MKKIAFKKLTISKLNNLNTIKGGTAPASYTCSFTSTDQSPIEEPTTDIYILDEPLTTLP